MRIVNLLPPTEQDLIRKQKILANLQKFVWISFATYAVTFGVMFFFRLYIEQTLSNLGQQIELLKGEVNTADNSNVKQKITLANGSVTDYSVLIAKNPQWSKVLIDFSKLVPVDTVVQNFNGNTASGRIDISGISASRQSVINLRDAIAGSPDFKNLQFPFDNYQKPVNLNFHMSFYLRDNILVPAQAQLAPQK